MDTTYKIIHVTNFYLMLNKLCTIIQRQFKSHPYNKTSKSNLIINKTYAQC